jgi:transcriptional regulator with XRE-family HTH domain
MLGIKQDALAADLGDDWNQQKISLLEQKETIDPALLEQISTALKIPAEAIQNFDEEAAISYINTFNDSSANQGTIGTNNNCQLTFNPIEKVMELFERLLASEREKVELMKEILGKIK